MRVKNALLLGTMLLSTALYGCGSNAGSGGDQSAAPDGGPNSSIEKAATVGVDVCTNCHAGQTAQWMGGVHANYETWDPAVYIASDTRGMENVGFPNYGYYGLGEGGENSNGVECASCHDQLGDGQRLTAELTGNVARPVISCESCHGGGGLHYGTGPLPYAAPDFERCGQCHNSSFDHQKTYSKHAESANILEDYKASPHATSVVYAPETPAKCSKCHTDEGAKLYKNVAGGYDDLGEAFPDGTPAVVDASPVQCRTCHNAHNPQKLLKDETVGAASAEFNTCTNCHQTTDAYHGENSKYSWSDRVVGSGAFDGGRIIYDTHFDDVSTVDVTDSTANIVEGYNIDPTNDRACRDCHNVHAADTTINKQWAKSGHGDRDAGAFSYYNFDEVGGENIPWGGAAQCQRCHTATGASNLLSSGSSSYNPATNSYNLIAGQNEVLYCGTCHTDNAGGLRKDNAFTTAMEPNYKDAAGQDIVFADVNQSNVCIPCHAGRQNGQSIKDRARTDFALNVDGKNFGTFTAHYLTAAGVLYKTVGYEFDGADYTNAPYFGHDQIGTLNADGNEVKPGTGDAGPCVSCHMNDSNDGGVPNHFYTPFAADSEGSATGIATVCTNCHAGDYALTLDFIDHEKEGFHAALDELKAQLDAKGVFFAPSYPYFFTDGTFSTPLTAWADEQTLGAAFNYDMLHHEPGAFAHNRYYSKRLIFDSIDFLDDGNLDGTIDLSSAPDAAEWFDGNIDLGDDGSVTRP